MAITTSNSINVNARVERMRRTARETAGAEMEPDMCNLSGDAAASFELGQGHEMRSNAVEAQRRCFGRFPLTKESRAMFAVRAPWQLARDKTGGRAIHPATSALIENQRQQQQQEHDLMMRVLSIWIWSPPLVIQSVVAKWFEQAVRLGSP